MSCVGQDMVRQSMPTAYAMSEGVCVEQIARCALLFGVERSFDELRQVVSLRRVILVEGRGHAVWQDHTIRVSGDVDVEEVANRTFVLDVPPCGQVCSEGRIERVDRVVGVQDKEVVDVAT
eukprot:1483127-Pleurochrysis_carterae.AAC.1